MANTPPPPSASLIDPTASVSPDVEVEDGVEVGRGAVVSGTGRLERGSYVGHCAVVEGDFVVGAGSRIDHHALVRGRVRMGRDNWIFPFAAVGTGPEHRSHMDADRADFARGFGAARDRLEEPHTRVCDGQPALPGGRTEIGSGCYILAYSHVAHDVSVSDSVTLATQALLGGHSEVGDHAYVGLGAETHQFTRIGRHAMVGMGSTILKDVLPYAVMIGTRFAKINEVGMRRGGMGEAEIGAVRRCYDRFEELGGEGEGGGPYAEQCARSCGGQGAGCTGRSGQAAACI